MVRAKLQYDRNQIRIRSLGTLYTHLKATLHLREDDIDDLLRSQIVYAVSALDKFIHELVKFGMVDIFGARRPPTISYGNFTLPLNTISQLTDVSIPAEYTFERFVINAHKHLSFQEPDKIGVALSLIWPDEHKWQMIASQMGTNDRDLKIELKNIVSRRNQIVHEADLDLSTGDIQPISQVEVQKAVSFLQTLCQAIYDLVA